LLSYIFNIIGEKNFDQHFPDLGRLEATLQKHHYCFSQQHLQKRYCCQSVKSCTLTPCHCCKVSRQVLTTSYKSFSSWQLKQGQCKAWRIPSPTKIDPVTLTFDLWPWQSIGFPTLIRINDISSLVKIHWRMLILECPQRCYGRTDGSVNISLRNFIGEGIISHYPSSKYSKSIFDCDFFLLIYFLIFVF
jgi:hypothetical protein